MSAPFIAISAGMSALIIEHPDPAAQAGQVASGRMEGGGAVPDRYGAATVIGRPEALELAGTVEPAAGPAESCPAAAGHHTPDAGACLPDPG